MLGRLLLLYLAKIWLSSWNLVKRKHGVFKNLDNAHKKYFLLLQFINYKTFKYHEYSATNIYFEKLLSQKNREFGSYIMK